MKKHIVILFVGLTLFSCEEKNYKRVPQVEIKEANEVGPYTISIEGEIIDQGNGIVQYGHCWNTEIDPTIDHYLTQYKNIDSSSQFISELNQLKPNTKYHIRAYIITHNQVAYSKSVSVNTLTLGHPEMVTGKSVKNNVDSLLVEGHIVSLGRGQNIIKQFGHCWSDKPEPTLANAHTVFLNAEDTGKFISSLDDIRGNKKYYIRAYGINDMGTVYGEQIEIVTAVQLPEIQLEPFYTDPDIIAFYYEVIDDGGRHLDSAWVHWSTEPFPTEEKNSNLMFTAQAYEKRTSWFLYGLSGSTTYYIRMNVKNSAGSNYSNTIIQTTRMPTAPQITMGITDIESNLFDTLLISEYVIENTGGYPIDSAGICWNTNGDPSITDNVIYFEEPAIGFPYIVHTNKFKFTKDSGCYIRFFAINKMGVGYSEEQFIEYFLTSIFND